MNSTPSNVPPPELLNVTIAQMVHAKAVANDTQVGGAHYKQHTYETWDVILDWNLGYLDGNAVKYLSRWRSKGGVQDLKKAAHYIQKLIEITELNERTLEQTNGKNP